jgi:hypothetical protein
VTAVADGHATASERQRMLSDAVARRILAELDRNASRADILSLFKVPSSARGRCDAGAVPGAAGDGFGLGSGLIRVQAISRGGPTPAWQ